MNIKKLFNLQSKEEKVREYNTLLMKSFNLSKKVDELASDFLEHNEVLKSISTLEADERKDAEQRYNEFLKEHSNNVAELQKEKASIEKSLSRLRRDEDLKEVFQDMEELFNAKISYKNRKIAKSIYDDIIKAKQGKIRYADVLLFRGSKLLILQRAGEKGGNTQQWCIPGGHVDAGEDFRTAAQRELFEETGIEVPEDTLIEVGVATGKNFEIHYFIGHVDDESPTTVCVDAEEEIGSAWIEPATELGDYEFIFDMETNIRKILGLEYPKAFKLVEIQKAFLDGDIKEEVFKVFCEQNSYEIQKANNKTYFSHKERKDLAKKGEAMPNGKYPIRNNQDLKDAIRLVGASDMPKSEVKAWIKKRAKELGLENELPESWNKKEDVEKGMDMNDVAPLKKEDLQDDTIGPQGDGIDDKKIEKAITFKKVEYEPKVVESEPNKYTYGEGQFSFSDFDGNHGDKLFDMLGMLQKVMTLNKKFSITIETEDNGEQTWNFDGTIRIHGLRKSENIEKSVNTENNTEGFKLLINFNDLDQVEVFKSIVNEMKESGKLDIESVIDDSIEIEKSWGINDIRKEVNNNPALDDGSQLAKAKDKMYKTFADYANFLEGVKTRSKNVHWGEEDNSKHVYLDDLIDELSDYEDKIMEAGQSGFGRFKDGEIEGEKININDPIELVDEIIERTKDFYEAISDDENNDYVGEVSWIEDFLATLKQTKYRLQMH